jgi:hypothetical protein
MTKSFRKPNQRCYSGSYSTVVNRTGELQIQPLNCGKASGLWRSLVSALDWGSRGPGFKSRQPDHLDAGQRIFAVW